MHKTQHKKKSTLIAPSFTVESIPYTNSFPISHNQKIIYQTNKFIDDKPNNQHFCSNFKEKVEFVKIRSLSPTINKSSKPQHHIKIHDNIDRFILLLKVSSLHKKFYIIPCKSVSPAKQSSV